MGLRAAGGVDDLMMRVEPEWSVVDLEIACVRGVALCAGACPSFERSDSQGGRVREGNEG